VPAEWQTGVCEQLLRRQIARSAVDVTVIDRQNYHLFQPLLYQVATAVLSPGDITEPIPGRPAVSTKRHSAPRRGDRYHGAPSQDTLRRRAELRLPGPRDPVAIHLFRWQRVAAIGSRSQIDRRRQPDPPPFCCSSSKRRKPLQTRRFTDACWRLSWSALERPGF